MRTTAGVAALLSLLAFAGCTAEPAAPPLPPPPPSPASQSPTETARERQERLDYAAAEKAYRTFRAEYERVLRAGGADEPTRVMRAAAGGDYLRTFTQVIKDYKRASGHATGKERIAYVRYAGYSPTKIALIVCEDGRRTTTVLSSGESLKGEVRMADIEARKVGEGWKVWSGTGRRVSRCD
jgi:hypothetical protein